MKTTIYLLISTLSFFTFQVQAQTNLILTSPASMSPGFSNTIIGVQAGNGITSGTENTIMGYQAGYLTTTGGINTYTAPLKPDHFFE